MQSGGEQVWARKLGRVETLVLWALNVVLRGWRTHKRVQCHVQRKVHLESKMTSSVWAGAVLKTECES